MVLIDLKQNKTGYGKIRLWGSLGFTAAVLVFGFSSANFPLAFLFYGSAGLLLMAFFFVPVCETKFFAEHQPFWGNLKFLLTDKKFLAFIIYAFLIQWAFYAHNSFFSLYFKSTGGSPALLGGAWALSAASEIPVFWLTQKWLKRWGSQKLLLFAGLVFGLRWILQGAIIHPWPAFWAQSLQGISYGLFLGVSVNYVNELVPRRLRTSGQSIYAAVTGGLGASLGCLLGGIIVDVMGVWKLYWIAGIVCLVGYLGYKYFKD